ncbi:MAG: hypothetical protein IPI55_12450 [Flavobacteriales bacterium]|nr:hypothetical protein [Flavobacteriales bacterium]
MSAARNRIRPAPRWKQELDDWAHPGVAGALPREVPVVQRVERGGGGGEPIHHQHAFLARLILSAHWKVQKDPH